MIAEDHSKVVQVRSRLDLVPNPDLLSMYAVGCMIVSLLSVDISCEHFGQMVVPEERSGGHPKH